MSTLKVKKGKRNISPDWLRKFKGFENYNDQKAEKELKELDELSRILCQHIHNTN